GVDARVKTHVWAVVVSNERARVVLEELCARQRACRPKANRRRLWLRIPIRIGFEMDFLEAVGGIARRSASRNGNRAAAHLGKVTQIWRKGTAFVVDNEPVALAPAPAPAILRGQKTRFLDASGGV